MYPFPGWNNTFPCWGWPLPPATPVAVAVAAGVLPLALGSENSGAVNWLQAQFAGRLVQKEIGKNPVLKFNGYAPENRPFAKMENSRNNHPCFLGASC